MTEPIFDATGNPIRDISDPYLVMGKAITLNGLTEEEAMGRYVWGLTGELLGKYVSLGRIEVKGGFFNGEIME